MDYRDMIDKYAGEIINSYVEANNNDEQEMDKKASEEKLAEEQVVEVLEKTASVYQDAAEQMKASLVVKKEASEQWDEGFKMYEAGIEMMVMAEARNESADEHLASAEETALNCEAIMKVAYGEDFVPEVVADLDDDTSEDEDDGEYEDDESDDGEDFEDDDVEGLTDEDIDYAEVEE